MMLNLNPNFSRISTFLSFFFHFNTFALRRCLLHARRLASSLHSSRPLHTASLQCHSSHHHRCLLDPGSTSTSRMNITIFFRSLHRLVISTKALDLKQSSAVSFKDLMNNLFLSRRKSSGSIRRWGSPIFTRSFQIYSIR